MENININSPEDIKKVKESIGAAISMLATMGNNDSEFDQISQIEEAFKLGQINADLAIDRINAIPWSKQQGGM